MTSYVKPPTNEFRAKLLSITIGKPSDLSTRTKRNYYDSDALHDVFPEDAEEQMRDETGGYTADELAAMNPAELGQWLDTATEGEDIV